MLYILGVWSILSDTLALWAAAPLLKIPGDLEDYRNTKPHNNKPLYPDIQQLPMNFQIGFIMSFWEKMVWYIWGYDGLIIGWFGIKDGLINTPKTFSDFLKKVLNVLLTNLEWFGIMQGWLGQQKRP